MSSLRSGTGLEEDARTSVLRQPVRLRREGFVRAARQFLMGRLSGVLLISLLCIFGSHRQTVQAAQPSEYEVKGAFVYNFIKFVEWPPTAFISADSSIDLYVLGQDLLADQIETLAGKTAQGRKIVVKRFTRLSDLEKCHVLYISRSESEVLPQILRALRDWNALIMGDTKDFAHLGGMMNFVRSENRVSFEVNVDAAERAGLKINAQLLKLAKIIRDGSKKGGR
jgi:hypothetical protein